MKRVTIPDVAVEERQSRIGGKMRDVRVVYTCSALDDCQSVGIGQEILDGAIERFLLKARQGLNQHGPIRICVEHCHGHRHNAPLQGLRYLKLYIEGNGPSMVMVY